MFRVRDSILFGVLAIASSSSAALFEQAITTRCDAYKHWEEEVVKYDLQVKAEIEGSTSVLSILGLQCTHNFGALKITSLHTACHFHYTQTKRVPADAGIVCATCLTKAAGSCD